MRWGAEKECLMSIKKFTRSDFERYFWGGWGTYGGLGLGPGPPNYCVMADGLEVGWLNFRSYKHV